MRYESSRAIFYSFIIPLYNRPKEIAELLETLVVQSFTNFEVLVIEDGSADEASKIVLSFSPALDVRYFMKPNSGQGFSRNFAFERAKGDFFILLDSDVLLPPDYLEAVDKGLRLDSLDSFGGPDAAHPSFTPVQKAISYAMTSFFTTGGIRGRKKNLGGTFHPRSFNMGLTRNAWEKAGGFVLTRLGEDLVFSINLQKEGFIAGFIPDAVVYHKRRTSMLQFYKQLHFFGRARINIFTFFPKELKAVHFFPALFTLFSASVISTFLLDWYDLFYTGASVLLIYAAAIFTDSLLVTRSFYIACLSLIASFIQLYAYGIGFMTDFFKRLVFRLK